MDLCNACKFNLSQYLNWFSNKPVKMFTPSCNQEKLRDHGIWKTCLELFAISILNIDYETFKDAKDDLNQPERLSEKTSKDDAIV